MMLEDLSVIQFGNYRHYMLETIPMPYIFLTVHIPPTLTVFTTFTYRFTKEITNNNRSFFNVT